MTNDSADPRSSDGPTISVVVCTHNRADSLANAVASLKQLESNKAFTFEILVIDNASSDNTKEVVEAAASDSIPANSSAPVVRYAYEPKPGVAHARNCGVESAHGEWIAFFDDDQLADAHWLSELFGFAVTKNVLCAGGRVELKLPPGVTRDLGPTCRDLLSETVNQPAARPYDRKFKPGAGNLLLHKSLFKEVGAFSPDYNDRGEDTILFLKIQQAGHESWYTPDAVVYHTIPAERLTDDAFVDLTRRVAKRLPAFEKDHWKALFPVAWAARIAQTICVFFPQWLIARVSGDKDRILEARCRLLMARIRIQHGMKWLFAGDPLLTS